MEKYSQVIFDKNTVEFVTVAAEFCGFLERARDMKRYDFVDTALKILPLLYLKATLLPPCEPIGEDEPETFVTEEDYELIRRAIAGVLGAKDVISQSVVQFTDANVRVRRDGRHLLLCKAHRHAA